MQLCHLLGRNRSDFKSAIVKNENLSMGKFWGGMARRYHCYIHVQHTILSSVLRDVGGAKLNKNLLLVLANVLSS